MRDYKGALAWYKKNSTTAKIGFNPNGMCLKVVRTARDIPARYPTAKKAQDATPRKHRVHKVRDLRRGMVLYYDDPNDSNWAGHIVTMIGRVKGFDPDSLHDILVETNSVKSGKVVVVRGDYFEKHWGDAFKFGATWLNGYELDVPQSTKPTNLSLFHKSGPEYNLLYLQKAAKNRASARRTLDAIMVQVLSLSDSPKLPRIRNFKNEVRNDGILNMKILDAAVSGGLTGKTKRVRDTIKDLLKELPSR